MSDRLIRPSPEGGFEVLQEAIVLGCGQNGLEVVDTCLEDGVLLLSRQGAEAVNLALQFLHSVCKQSWILVRVPFAMTFQ